MKLLVVLLSSLLLVSTCLADFNDVYEGWLNNDFNSYKVSYMVDSSKGRTHNLSPTSVTCYVDANSYVIDVHASKREEGGQGWYSFDGKMHRFYSPTTEASTQGFQKYTKIRTTWNRNVFSEMLGNGGSSWMRKSRTEPYTVMQALKATNDLGRSNPNLPQLIRQPNDGDFEVYAVMVPEPNNGPLRKWFQATFDPNISLPVKLEAFDIDFGKPSERRWLYSVKEMANGVPKVFSVHTKQGTVVYTVTSFERNVPLPKREFPKGIKVYDEDLNLSYIVE